MQKPRGLTGPVSTGVHSMVSYLSGQEHCCSWRGVMIKLNAKRGGFQSPRIIAEFLLLLDLCYATGGFELRIHTNTWLQQQKAYLKPAETFAPVFLSKLKQLTTNSTCSSFHQEVSTLLKKQEPKLDVFSKTQGQKICSSGVNPKLVFHQSHSFPSFVPYLKGLMPIFLTLSPAAETLLLNGSYPDSDGDN